MIEEPALWSNFGDDEIRACWQKAADADLLDRSEWVFSLPAYKRLCAVYGYGDDAPLRTILTLYSLPVIVYAETSIWFGIRVRAQ